MAETQPVAVDQCSTCKYVRPRMLGTVEVLECRFSDPFMQGTRGIWPIVKAEDWCGKFVAQTGG